MLPILCAEQVSYTYPQDHRGISRISFSIDKGNLLSITGPSGSGKSTLTRCLCGLIPHLYHGQMFGKVWINGHSTDEMQMWEISRHVGMVFQNPAAQILASSVEQEIIFGLENLGFSRAEVHERLEEMLDHFDLAKFRKRKPISLSGGEQQKLALAAVFARAPSVLILDEPLSMLDSTAAEDFLIALQKTKSNGNCVVICEHRRHYLQKIPFFHEVSISDNDVPEAAAFDHFDTFPRTRTPFTLCIDKLSVTRGNNRILNNLSLECKSGQVIALVGRNGSGKTTLLRALAGLQSYDGSIQTDDNETFPQFNIVFQNPDTQLFNPSVREEILYKLPLYDLNLYNWLMQALDLKRYENTQPLLLSEGEKRRVALATAIMHPHKQGILLDEPSLGQDQTHKELLVNLLRSIANAGWFVLFSTHDLELASQADRIVLLTDHGIVTEGKTKNILGNSQAWNDVGLVLPEWVKP